MRRALSLLTGFALAACGGGGGGGGGTPAATTPPVVTPAVAPPTASMLVEGAVQKGPFIVGSTVLINRLDSRGRSTASTRVAQIRDSIGSFSFETDELGPVQIVATGYYFSELTGQISDGVLTLRALYEISSQTRQVARVNILTHLINDRVLELIADGQPSLRDAIEQAEDELVAALSDALQVTDLNDFFELSVYDTAESQNNPLGNAYLLALSTGFYRYAKTKAQEFGTATDAELTLALNRFSDDLADDGRLQPGPFIEDFVTAIRSLSPETIAANLRSRSLVDYPRGLDVPDISVFLSLCAGNFDCPWSAGAPMPLNLSGHATAVHAGKIYVFGGSTQSGPYVSDAVNAYDPVANEWSPKHSMPAPSWAATAHTIDDTIYVVFGANASMQLQNGLYAYDPVADQWSPRAPRPTYRTHFASVAVNGLLYVIGGVGQTGNGPGPAAYPYEHKSHVEIYNPATNTWSTGAPLPTALTEARACAVGGQIYVFAGWSVAGLERSILSYDTASSSWTAKSPMQTASYSAFDCVTMDDAVYLVGGVGSGSHGSILGTVDRYDPFVDTWSSPTRLQTPRSSLAAAAIGGRIFTLGGRARYPSQLSDRTVNVVEILDTDRL
jgi:N-acetylneuraminic acid mutarotase